MYSDAKHGESVVMIHLFGIKYASEIEASGVNREELAQLATSHSSYVAEINKGVKLAKYVKVK